MYNNLKIREELNNEYSKKELSIKSAYTSGSLFLFTAPIAITNMTENDILPVIVTLLETGLLTISLVGIKKTINTSKKIKLLKNNFTENKNFHNSKINNNTSVNVKKKTF